jgi:hypothetical protein
VLPKLKVTVTIKLDCDHARHWHATQALTVLALAAQA